MKVESTMKVYEITDEETLSGLPEVRLIIRSHGSFRGRIILDVGGKMYSVVSLHLVKAIQNAENYS